MVYLEPEMVLLVYMKGEIKSVLLIPVSYTHLDAAREKIYTQVDYLMGQEIDKPEARAYMEDKINKVETEIDKNEMAAAMNSMISTAEAQVRYLLSLIHIYGLPCKITSAKK